MSSYFIDFTAFIDERKRPDGFRREVHIQETYNNILDTEHLQLIVNERFIKLVSSAGIVALKNPDEIIDSKITFDKRIFIPWHMVTHMSVNVMPITEPSIPISQDVLIPINAIKEKESKKAN
jgi:hypothetical protein